MEILYSCRRDCCPKMVYDPELGLILITDDYGVTIKLTRPQFEVLMKAYGEKFSQGAELNA